jgi:molybdopterin converting factor subunit 1
MRVRVCFFASVRERLRREAEDVELPDGAEVGDLWRALVAMHPRLEDVGRSVRFAVNREYVEVEQRLADGDEVAVIPPVSGGT